MRKKTTIIIVVAIVLAAALFLAWGFSKPKEAQAPVPADGAGNGAPQTPPSGRMFKGPTGEPFVNGPTSPPPTR